MSATQTTQRVQNYEVEEELFRAGPSTIFRGRNAVLGHPVRLRRLTLDPARAQDARDTFYREMRLSAALWHPRIQRPLDIVEADGYLWSVHEFYSTQPSDRWVEERGLLSVSEAARMGAQTADALAHMHAHGHVHGRVSPMSVHADEQGSVQLINLVKAADLAAGIWPLRPPVLGLSAFTAPEEFAGNRPTPATDVYGLAATIVFWLTRSYPRGGQGGEDAMERARAGAPPVRIRELRPDVPAAMAEALDAALEADPTARRGSAPSFASLLADVQKRLAAEIPTGFEPGAQLTLDGSSDSVRLIGRHGAGAFGVVFRAKSDGTGHELAVKALKPEHRDDQEAVERFLREARALQGIAHPNVVRIRGVGEARSTPFAVMDFVAGPDLGTMILKEGMFPAPRAAAIARGIACGLDAIHRGGIIHRDLKPHNILMAGGDHPVIADFGVARTAAATRLTGTGHLVGTLAYMAPELFEDRPITHAVDLYALGAILHEMLTGAYPFPLRDPVGTIRAIREQQPPPLPSNVPDDVAAVTRRLLEKEPQRRFARAADVVDALQSVR